MLSFKDGIIKCMVKHWRGCHKFFVSFLALFAHFICGFLSFKWVARKPGKPNRPPSRPPSFPTPDKWMYSFPFPKPIVLLEIRKALGGAEIILLLCIFLSLSGQGGHTNNRKFNKAKGCCVRSQGRWNYLFSSLVRLSIHTCTHTRTHIRQSIERVFYTSSILFQLFPFLERVLHPPLLLLHCFDSSPLLDRCFRPLALWLLFPLLHTTELDRPLSHCPSFGVSIPRHQQQIWSLPHFCSWKVTYFPLPMFFLFLFLTSSF